MKWSPARVISACTIAQPFWSTRPLSALLRRWTFSACAFCIRYLYVGYYTLNSALFSVVHISHNHRQLRNSSQITVGTTQLLAATKWNLYQIYTFSISPFPRCIIIICLSKHKCLFYATWWVSFGCCCRRYFYFYYNVGLSATHKWPNSVVTRKT